MVYEHWITHLLWMLMVNEIGKMFSKRAYFFLNMNNRLKFETLYVSLNCVYLKRPLSLKRIFKRQYFTHLQKSYLIKHTLSKFLIVVVDSWNAVPQQDRPGNLTSHHENWSVVLLQRIFAGNCERNQHKYGDELLTDHSVCKGTRRK